MPLHSFDDQAIRWTRFGEFEPRFDYTILNIDEPRRILDVLFRLPAGGQIVLHRHLALNHTFVVQGEHRLYEPDGRLRETRATGSLTVSPASPAPHREGGGEQDAIVHFSIRPDQAEALYEILDDGLKPLLTITWTMLVELYQAQQAALR